jgi:hypothetical protein
MPTIERPKFKPPPAPSDGGLTWHDLAALGVVEGRGFDDVSTPYNRLPARARELVRPEVWELSTHSAGLSARFVTNAASLRVRWTLRHPGELSSPHMSATGASGLDLYVKLKGAWRWQAVASPERAAYNEAALIDAAAPMKPGRREFLLYLPLYNGVTRVEIGIPSGATIERAPAATAKPLCCYGTSIVQGDCASRAGMAYPAMLGRWFDRPAINLGFSGQGRAEPEMAELLAEIDASAYVIDALPNLVHELVETRIPAFVQTLRGARPLTPIVLIESIAYPDGQLVRQRFDRASMSNIALRKVHRDLQAAGMRDLHLVSGSDLLGKDGEATVDGTHPSDLGLFRIATALRQVLKRILLDSRAPLSS